MRKQRITERAKEEYIFLRDTPLDTIGVLVGIGDPRDNANGFTAMECWYARDARGEVLPCREFAELSKVERSKKSWNLQIEQWAEDIADGLLLRQAELIDYCHGLPSWIFSATINQAQKTLKRTVGFVPSFARVVRVFGQWWPPEMASWSPSI